MGGEIVPSEESKQSFKGDFMRENWNFHVDIAMELEDIAKDYYKWNQGRPIRKIYDADAIQNDSFILLMLILLVNVTEQTNDIEEINEFKQNALKYISLNPNEIDVFEVEELFNRFKQLYNKYSD